MPPKEVKQLLYNPNQLSSFFGSLAEQFGFSEENECSVGDSYSSISVQDPGKKENFSWSTNHIRGDDRLIVPSTSISFLKSANGLIQGVESYNFAVLSD